MNTETIMADFMERTAKIIAEIRNRTCMDEDAEVIKELLQDELTEYCFVLNGYYEEEYFNAISSARSKAYDAGWSDGYDDGYENGYADCHAKNHYC